jgi:hypothetical protein
MDSTARVLGEVADERTRQDAKWGEQNHPDGTGSAIPWPLFVGDGTAAANRARELTDRRAKAGTVTFRDILTEEAAEAYAESDPAKLRAELIQIAAVACAWAEAIDRRTGS